jgi:hypothetical protein
VRCLTVVESFCNQDISFWMSNYLHNDTDRVDASFVLGGVFGFIRLVSCFTGEESSNFTGDLLV